MKLLPILLIGLMVLQPPRNKLLNKAMRIFSEEIKDDGEWYCIERSYTTDFNNEYVFFKDTNMIYRYDVKASTVKNGYQYNLVRNTDDVSKTMKTIITEILIETFVKKDIRSCDGCPVLNLYTLNMKRRKVIKKEELTITD